MSGLFKTFHQIRDDADLGDSTLVDEVQDTVLFNARMKSPCHEFGDAPVFSLSSDQATRRNS